jgi:hypothetical protein
MAGQNEVRLTVMNSGNETILQALIDGRANGIIPQARIVKIFTNRKAAYAAKRGELAGISPAYLNLGKDGFQAPGEKDDAKLKDAHSRYDARSRMETPGRQAGPSRSCRVDAHISEAFLTPVGKIEMAVSNYILPCPALRGGGGGGDRKALTGSIGKYDGAGALGVRRKTFRPESWRMRDGHDDSLCHRRGRLGGAYIGREAQVPDRRDS